MGVWTLIALFGGAMGVLGTVLSDRAEYDLSRKGPGANMRLHGIALAVGLAGWVIAVVGIVIDLLEYFP